MPDRAYDRSLKAGQFRFVLTVYANLTLPVDQEPPSLYTDAGLAAGMHSLRLLRRTDG